MKPKHRTPQIHEPIQSGSAVPDTRGGAAYSHMLSNRAKAAQDAEQRARRATVHALEWVLLPHKMNSLGGYDRSTGPTWYLIDDKDRGWYSHYIWNSRLTGGVATITHRKSAEKRHKSKATSQRWARRLHRLGLVAKMNVPDEKHGGLKANQYRALDPSYPHGPQGDALAIVYGGKVRVLTTQPIEIPPVPDKAVPPEKSKPGPAKKTTAVADLPLPGAWGMGIAEKAGLTDRLEIALLWAEYEKHKAAGRIQKTLSGYWYGMCEKRVKELADAGVQQSRFRQQTWPVLQLRTAEQERVDRNRYLLEQAALMLADDWEPQQVIERLLKEVYPAGLCYHTGPTHEDARRAVEEARAPAAAIKAERDRKKVRLVVSDETRSWLRQRYAEVLSLGRTKEERELMGDLTPAQAAHRISVLSNRPDELRQATPEQIEKLLLDL